MKETQGNGCGPAYMPRWLKKALFTNWMFESSCDKHDIGYTIGGDEARRLHCDVKFLEAMRRDTLRKRGLQRGIRWLQAYCFYYAVRLGGKKSFNYKD